MRCTRGLNAAWFIIEPFAGFEGAAHTMVSFGFEDGRFVTFSVEIRREKGEAFSALAGLFRQFEIVYVVGDEGSVSTRDVQLGPKVGHAPHVVLCGRGDAHRVLGGEDCPVIPVQDALDALRAEVVCVGRATNGGHVVGVE